MPLSCSASTLALVALLSLVPGVEGRYALLLGLSCLELAAPLAYILSTLAGLTVYTILGWLEARILPRLPPLARLYARIRAKIEARFGEVTRASLVALFIAVPLPGSGVWTGALAARIAGLKRLEAYAAIAAGNLAAITATTAAASIAKTLATLAIPR